LIQLKYLFELNKVIDRVSLYWALAVLFIGVFAMVRARNIIQAMQRINNPFEHWWRKKGYTPKQLEDEMTMYVRLFSAVWISCGLFWTYWVLFHKY
jgi:hypothetical protein